MQSPEYTPELGSSGVIRLQLLQPWESKVGLMMPRAGPDLYLSGPDLHLSACRGAVAGAEGHTSGQAYTITNCRRHLPCDIGVALIPTVPQWQLLCWQLCKGSWLGAVKQD